LERFSLQNSPHSALDSRESTLLSLLLPLISPDSGADLQGHVLHALAPTLVVRGLQTEKPFVVSVPAVVRLILGRKTSISGGSPSGLDLVE